MLEIKNQTSYEVAVIPSIDKEGYDYATVVVKGTFDIKNNLARLSLSDEQVPIVYGETYFGEPGQSSVKYESDTCLVKKGCDIVLLGHAYTNGRNRKVVDVSLQIGQLNKTVRVFGNRKWYRSLVSWRRSAPIPFDRMLLTYEKAFGGKDESHSNPTKHEWEKRNPVGTGFCVSGTKKRLEELPLPNLEDPKAVIKNWKDKPSPAGFGFIARNWIPRVKYAGTYDDSWQKKRCPLLPNDFDEFFFNGASPDLIASDYLKGGEPVKVFNASSNGNISFNLPKISFDISVWIKGEMKVHTPNLDTVIIEPDEQKMILVWRTAVPCFRAFLYIDRIRIKQTTG